MRTRMLLPIVLAALSVIPARRTGAAEAWPEALAGMPLQSGSRWLTRTNAAEVLLNSFQSNRTVKALILMPMAQEEFYLFRRARAEIAKPNPSLLDAIDALTNQTLIRVHFEAPFLLLGTREDVTAPLVTIEDSELAQKLREKPFVPHFKINDRNWDSLLPVLHKQYRARIRPLRNDPDSWHFWRHTMAGWNLNGYEALEALSLAGKTRFTLKRSKIIRWPTIIFEGDPRNPTVDDRPAPD